MGENKNVDLSINFAGISMPNPVTVGSGTFGAGLEFNELFDVSVLGAITTKGVSLEAWAGNESPRIAKATGGMINAIGLQNPGASYMVEEVLPKIKDLNSNIIVNVLGKSQEEYVETIKVLETSDVPCAYEINISCPNVKSGGLSLGTDPKCVQSLVSACKNVTNKPIIAKLTPNVTSITEIALAAKAGGADALTLINTVAAMAIDIKTRRPKLANVCGGLSGPAIKPIAVKAVYDVHKVCDLPIIGIGGITCAQDAIEFILAGASVVSIGSANFTNPFTTLEVIKGLENYCIKNNILKISDLIGAVEV
ncbi:MAG: dihydroorotate dehydrogenase [Coriobacteriales bacterium]|nr:dihydroorotate dehydrogenase [Coriobacteriales bacterium]